MRRRRTKGKEHSVSLGFHVTTPSEAIGRNYLNIVPINKIAYFLMNTSIAVWVHSLREPWCDGCVCDDVVGTKIAAKGLCELDEPIGRLSLSEKVHLFVVDVDAVESIVLHELGDVTAEEKWILAHGLRCVGGTEDRHHQFHAGTGVSRLEPSFVGRALGRPLGSVVSNAELDGPEGEVEDVEAGDVPVGGSAVRLAWDVLVTVENKSRGCNAVGIGGRESRVKDFYARCILNDLGRTVGLAEERGDGRPDAMLNTSGNAVVVELGGRAFETVVAVVKALLVRDGRDTGSGSDKGGGSSDGGRSSYAHVGCLDSLTYEVVYRVGDGSKRQCVGNECKGKEGSVWGGERKGVERVVGARLDEEKKERQTMVERVLGSYRKCGCRGGNRDSSEGVVLSAGRSLHGARDSNRL